MVVEGSRRIQNQRNNARNKSVYANVIKTLKLYPFIDNSTKASVFTLIVILCAYVLANFILLGLFLLKSIGYYWYTHLIFFGILCLYVFCGGFAYYSYYAKKEYLMFCYIALLAFAYCPIIKVVYVIAKAIIPNDIAYYVLSIVEMTLSMYIIKINLDVFCVQQYYQRSAIIQHIIIFVVQAIGVLLSYLPFQPIVLSFSI